jgi:[ribosomal protein S5]-alanine N-acetyltransferase
MIVLTTSRLILRPVTLGDVDALHQLWTEPDVRRYLWDDIVITRERAEETVRDSIASVADRLGMWTVIETQSGELTGFVALIRREPDENPELMYGLSSRFWGRGFATEAARAALTYAFGTFDCAKVIAATDVPNCASVRVMERLGFQFSRRGLLNNLDTFFYEIERKTFESIATVPTDTPRR